MRWAECFLRSRSRYVFSIRAVMYIMYKNIVENKIIFYDTRTHTNHFDGPGHLAANQRWVADEFGDILCDRNMIEST